MYRPACLRLPETWLRAKSFKSGYSRTPHSRQVHQDGYISMFSNSAPSSRFEHVTNEPVLQYLKGSSERENLFRAIREIREASPIEIPMVINGKSVRSDDVGDVRLPHEHKTVIARYHKAGPEHIEEAIASSIDARKSWAKLPSDDRLSIFLKAAELLSDKYWRSKIVAATVLGQSKTIYQAELDAACELIDFWRFGAYYSSCLYEPQPNSLTGVWNRLVYRPLEGFVYAISPFNFTAIGGNLVSTPVMLGNVAFWKPSSYSLLSNYYTMLLLKEAGLPDGVINFVPGDPAKITDKVIVNRQLAGIHYTGSTDIFRRLYTDVGKNISNYISYPRIVGETGGKGFVFAHRSADISALVVAIIRGAFEYAGQKCSAASRAYIPASIWPMVKAELLEKMKSVKLGSPESPDVFVNAVIHNASFEKSKSYIDYARASSEAEIIYGGNCDNSVGYFVDPTIIVTSDPYFKSMVEEIFGPIMTIYVYSDDQFIETLKICDSSTPYSLTGCFWANDREAIRTADYYLENTAGNFYINDKPTAAVVAQQPFGGSRASGTNDKAGSHLNLIRWVSARVIKETFMPTHDVLYPYMK
ncbi:delta-1-pyrroline-5-carboxylate dehydrogenase, mitochondrial-like [Schistocerca gregaria]|uniref:delta-1-pyrroline-5-carboxylate dehydrogenase, mitochondrial-like n=1 Tax=Schistocerca gregaria TaxID=7010 RepID=UPI00211E20AB|nr:delta-1-pyrroline-5-carboxylate dehydrogenase, mitochondrial-like [Schistocerca gregaria]